MNQFHQELLKQLQQAPKTKLRHHDSSYSGSPRPSFGLSSPTVKNLTKEWVKQHKDLSFQVFLDLLNSLYKADSQEERSVAGFLLRLFPKLRTQINPQQLDLWLNTLEGWGEIDGLCQGNFDVAEFNQYWPEWKQLLENLAKSDNIGKRRASLVLLTTPVRHTADPSFSELAFKNISKLQAEREILITKAISWLLRDLVAHHRAEVIDFLEQNSETLPKIAIRETKRKLLTGKK